MLRYRPASQKGDLEYAYDLFKRLTKDMVIEHRGEWPEPHQSDFFADAFKNSDMWMLVDCGTDVSTYGKTIGCFCIDVRDDKVYLQRMYWEPEYQGQGIGTDVIQLALAKAHELQKPLELGVLQTNQKAHDFYLRNGFVQTGVNDWEYEMRHQDTFQYVKTPRHSKKPPQPKP